MLNLFQKIQRNFLCSKEKELKKQDLENYIMDRYKKMLKIKIHQILTKNKFKNTHK